jgi:hypothetical protein
MKNGLLIRITTTYFCCGVIVDENWTVIEAAPIVKWMLGNHLSILKTWLQKRDAFVGWEVLRDGNHTRRRRTKKDKGS